MVAGRHSQPASFSSAENRTEQDKLVAQSKLARVRETIGRLSRSTVDPNRIEATLKVELFDRSGVELTENKKGSLKRTLWLPEASIYRTWTYSKVFDGYRKR
jgi:hypothetical protein